MVYLRALYVFGFVLALALLLQGCGELKTKFRHYTPESIHGFWGDDSAKGQEYTAYTISALKSDGQDLVANEPADVSSFCPAYSMLDENGRTAFWVALISAVADRESSFNAEAHYLEKFSDSTGQRVISRGLLQLSLESVRAYGCDIHEAGELLEPQKNLLCGVRVLNQLVAKGGVISGRLGPGDRTHWLGGARYWSVLRPGNKLSEIRAAILKLAVCRL
jgi:hypothetical protein